MIQCMGATRWVGDDLGYCGVGLLTNFSLETNNRHKGTLNSEVQTQKYWTLRVLSAENKQTKRSIFKLIMRMSADTPGYKGVVPTRQELMPGTNKSRQLPVIGIRPRPFLCQMIPLQTLPTTEKQTNKLKTQMNKQGWATLSHRYQTQTHPL